MLTQNKYTKLLADFDKLVLRIKKATKVNINESQKDKLKRVAELKKEYEAWFEYYFPQYAKVKCAWFHKKLANYIIK